ncbi:PBP1A family penicillin-binding protein [Candidatus Microgenomates bacterium]|nr:PBP1A family penicillin-binding protein [Candidatus Microgenomates bacterium]
MDRENNNNSSKKTLGQVLDKLLLIPLFLIKIGGLVRGLIKNILAFVQLIFKKTTGLLGSELLTLVISFWKFLGTKTISLNKKISTTLRSITNLFSSFFSLPKKIKLPKPSFPKPRISLPQFSSANKSFILGILFTLLFIFIPFQAYSWLTALPHPKILSLGTASVATKIYDRNGFLLYEVYLDENRTPISLDQIPDHLKKATLAIEDSQFYSHSGFSVKGILRALKKLTFDNKIEGGSTITQQLIRSALLTPERTLKRKTKEIILAFWAEKIYSKDEILEMYFNQVPYGGSAWGIETASQIYFGKNASQLSLAEASLLAGLPAAPSDFSPFGTFPEKAKNRQFDVLRRMVEEKFISQEEAETARNEDLNFVPQRIPIHAPHFVMYIKDLLVKKYGHRLVEQGGLRVITSLDLLLQEEIEAIVKNEVLKLSSLNVGNGSVVITNPKTGEILAMVGSKDYFNLEEEGNVNITLSLQQPGSSIKVVTYAAALQNGFTAASILDDSPVVYKIPGQPSYAPVNYDGKFHGKVPLRYALGNSYNIPAVKTLAQIGLEQMIEQGKRMGIENWEDKSRFGLSLTLGGGEVTMLDMARVYGSLANQGIKHKLRPILEITDYEGRILEKNADKNGVKALSEETAFIISDILSDDQARTSAFGPNSLLNIPNKKVAVKTGTSNDLRDNWAIGYTPSYVVVAWVGNNDNSPMSRIASGITGATPIWHETMKFLLEGKENEEFVIPAGITKIFCRGKWEYFVKGTEPLGGCPPIPTQPPSPTPMS